MHVAGDSMLPLILPKAVIAVDMHVTDRAILSGKIVLVSHRDLGFKIGARLLMQACGRQTSWSPRTRSTRLSISRPIRHGRSLVKFYGG